MTEHHLTLGAHMLLWGFPIALLLWVAAASIRDSRRVEDDS
jgi:cytochrome c-type biogenesis protein CcmH/NrfF